MRLTRLTPFACFLLIAASAGAQRGPSIVGSWRLVSMTVPDSSGRQRPTWDEHPSGRIMYTADGHMAAQLYDTRRAKIGLSVPQAPAEAARATLAGLFAYFGRYTIDTVTRRVSHQVEGAFLPDWVGANLIREYRFISDNLVELRVVNDAAGRTPTNPTVLVWERVGR